MRGFTPVVAKVRRTKSQSYLSPAQWAALQKLCFERDGHRCRQCGNGKPAVRKLEAHHIIPVHRGGATALYNLKTLCDRCHDRQPFHGHLMKARTKGVRR